MLPEINARDERKRSGRIAATGAAAAARSATAIASSAASSGRWRRRAAARWRRRAASRWRPAAPRCGQHAPARRPAPHAQQPPQEPRPFEQRPVQTPVAINVHEHDALARVGTPLGDAAATVFAQLRNGQPLPVRQLAAMMRKRNLVEARIRSSCDRSSRPSCSATSAATARSACARASCTAAAICSRPGPVAMSQTAEAEAGVADRAVPARRTRRTARSRSGSRGERPRASSGLIHAYLVAAGYREIDWVKRVGGISYASATAPGIVAHGADQRALRRSSRSIAAASASCASASRPRTSSPASCSRRPSCRRTPSTSSSAPAGRSP